MREDYRYTAGGQLEEVRVAQGGYVDIGDGTAKGGLKWVSPRKLG